MVISFFKPLFQEWFFLCLKESIIGDKVIKSSKGWALERDFKQMSLE
jgi:hypothetical protein